MEELPPGSAGGPGAGQRFPRNLPDYPEGTPCVYCGTPTTKEPEPGQLHREHIIPRSQGGNNSIENRAPSCRTCNLEKGPRTPSEWYDPAF
ncbi:MAG: HNH endonuclease [Alphaproteobacteria bacterium]|nr:HNH endonuclease [Alphaproteobacteria bacterium]